MGYRYETASVEGFIQQLAVCYLRNGYYFYVPGSVPEGKDPGAVDRKLIARYGVDLSKWARARRKRAGWANLQYLRHGRFFLLLATHGRHRFFAEEAAVVRDARRVPVTFAGYSVSYRGGHPRVAIEANEYRCLKAYFLDLAVRRPAEDLAGEIRRLPFEPYAPVRAQLFNLLRAVNAARKAAGLGPVQASCVRVRRKVCRPFTADSYRQETPGGVSDGARPGESGGTGRHARLDFVTPARCGEESPPGGRDPGREPG